MSELAKGFKCKVCGRPVAPQEVVSFGAFGTPLFVVHKGACSELVRSGTQAAGKLTRLALQAKKPALFDRLGKFVRLAQQIQDVLKEPEEKKP